MTNWVEDELKTVDLGDERLDRRYSRVLDALGRKPAMKFTAACNGHAEVQGAYRFVNNPHDATRQRCREHPVVLAVQDTSEVDVTRPNEEMTGAGPLSADGRLGFFLHPLMAFTPGGLPLGLVHVNIWARDPDEAARPAAEKQAERQRKPFEEKESVRWRDGYRAAGELADACPDTQVICISDSEGDIFECFFDALPQQQGRKADWIIRACEDGALVQGEAAEASVGRLFAQVAQAPVLATLCLEVRARPAQSGDGRKRKQARSARKATMTVQAARVTLRQPARGGGKRMADVAVNAVLVREVSPPAGEAPVEWLLLTSLPIDTVDQVLLVVEYYCQIWQIEIYFKVVKSGCQVEKSQLETAEAFLPYVALCLIVAWRVQQLLMLGRECPELPSDCVLTEAEWQAVYAVVKGEEPPEQAPPLGEMVKLIARLGGYLDRKGDGPPGPKAMWVGLQRRTDLALGWQARGHPPGPEKKATPRPKAGQGRQDSAAHQPPPPPSPPP